MPRAYERTELCVFIRVRKGCVEKRSMILSGISRFHVYLPQSIPRHDIYAFYRGDISSPSMLCNQHHSFVDHGALLLAAHQGYLHDCGIGQNIVRNIYPGGTVQIKCPAFERRPLFRACLIRVTHVQRLICRSDPAQFRGSAASSIIAKWILCLKLPPVTTHD